MKRIVMAPRSSPWPPRTPGLARPGLAASKPIEFVVTSSPGGGTDNFTRMIQSIIPRTS
jgi:hypothetical protein